MDCSGNVWVRSAQSGRPGVGCQKIPGPGCFLTLPIGFPRVSACWRHSLRLASSVALEWWHPRLPGSHLLFVNSNILGSGSEWPVWGRPTTVAREMETFEAKSQTYWHYSLDTQNRSDFPTGAYSALCVCVYLCVCTYVCLCECILMLCILVCVYLCVCVLVCVRTYVCILVCVLMCVCVYFVCTPVCVLVCTRVCVCTHVYVCVCMLSDYIGYMLSLSIFPFHSLPLSPCDCKSILCALWWQGRGDVRRG